MTAREIPQLVCATAQGCQRRTYLHHILVIPAPFYCCHCGFTTKTRLAAFPGHCQHAAIRKAPPACQLLLFLKTIFFTLSQCNPAQLAISHSACHASQCRVRAERCILTVQHTAQGHALGSSQCLFSVLISDISPSFEATTPTRLLLHIEATVFLSPSRLARGPTQA